MAQCPMSSVFLRTASQCSTAQRLNAGSRGPAKRCSRCLWNAHPSGTTQRWGSVSLKGIPMVMGLRIP